MSMAERYINYVRVLLLSCVAILITQLAAKKGDLELGPTIVGFLIVTGICLLAQLISEIKCLKKIPTFAWASLFSLLFTTPWCPFSEFVLKYTANVSTGQIGTVILVVAGVSIGTRLADVKRLSWKIMIVSAFVFCGTFFGSALIAQAILKFQGII